MGDRFSLSVCENFQLLSSSKRFIDLVIWPLELMLCGWACPEDVNPFPPVTAHLPTSDTLSVHLGWRAEMGWHAWLTTNNAGVRCHRNQKQQQTASCSHTIHGVGHYVEWKTWVTDPDVLCANLNRGMPEFMEIARLFNLRRINYQLIGILMKAGL